MNILVKCLLLIVILSLNVIPQDGAIKLVEGGGDIYSVVGIEEVNNLEHSEITQ